MGTVKAQSPNSGPKRPAVRRAAKPRAAPLALAAERIDATMAADDVEGGAEIGVLANRRRGRGATSNASGRYERESRVVIDDGWETPDDLPTLKTDVQVERPRKIITRNQSPDVPFDRSINPYRGCEHGCSYCFARPTHAYMGLSPGLDFETKLFAKPNAAQLLERELSAPGYQVKPIAIGTNTDPYQPIERREKIMRQVLEVLEKYGHPVTVLTKSALVVRDLDILERMAKRNLVKVGLSITTLDARLARAMEPRASTPPKRLAAVRTLAAAGIPAMVMVAPIIPALNDSEIERILAAAAEAGAQSAGYVLLRLPLEVSEIFKQWLTEHYPDRYRHVMSLIRSMRDGKDYDADWSTRMRGTGPYATLIRQRFMIALKRLGLQSRTKLETDLFIPPRGGAVQLSLF